MKHRYKLGDYVTLNSGRGAVILSLWFEDDGTPGYSVLIFATGVLIAIHDSHLLVKQEVSK